MAILILLPTLDAFSSLPDFTTALHMAHWAFVSENVKKLRASMKRKMYKFLFFIFVWMKGIDFLGFKNTIFFNYICFFKGKNIFLNFKQLKINSMARTSTYLNFPDNTEEAFNFYKSVFGGEFGNDGIARFGDIPPFEGMPPLSEADKNLVMHIELSILGGHVLMGTDAPESMGFKVNMGNNMYINLEPDTRTETQRLFNELSVGGTVNQELQDMFWGAYYGSCTDKYGVQWMFNCAAKQ